MEAGAGTSHIDGIAEEQGRGPEAISFSTMSTPPSKRNGGFP